MYRGSPSPGSAVLSGRDTFDLKLIKILSATHVFSIPLCNFMGWSGLIFFFEVLWLKAQNWYMTVGKRRVPHAFLSGLPS